MATNSRQQKRQGNTLSLLNVAIEAMNLAKEVTSATPAKAVFGTVSALLTMIRVRSLPVSDIVPYIHTSSGLHGQQIRLRRARTSLRRCV